MLNRGIIHFHSPNSISTSTDGAKPVTTICENNIGIQATRNSSVYGEKVIISRNRGDGLVVNESVVDFYNMDVITNGNYGLNIDNSSSVTINNANIISNYKAIKINNRSILNVGNVSRYTPEFYALYYGIPNQIVRNGYSEYNVDNNINVSSNSSLILKNTIVAKNGINSPMIQLDDSDCVIENCVIIGNRNNGNINTGASISTNKNLTIKSSTLMTAQTGVLLRNNGTLTSTDNLYNNFYTAIGGQNNTRTIITTTSAAVLSALTNTTGTIINDTVVGISYQGSNNILAAENLRLTNFKNVSFSVSPSSTLGYNNFGTVTVANKEHLWWLTNYATPASAIPVGTRDFYDNKIRIS
jgi:hypothetical protein